MANTYSQLYYHVVFAVQGRRAIIADTWKYRLYSYIIGISNHKKEVVVTINGMPDHVHILLRSQPNMRLSDLVRDIKASSSKWINDSGLTSSRFEWQLGFGAFSVSPGNVDRIKRYIAMQEEHHREITLRAEYIGLLRASGVDYKE